jgi:hypothetical protein
MATWFTGLLVAARIVRSASLRPENNQTSPLRAIEAASSNVTCVELTRRTVRSVRLWKWLGLAGLVGAAAVGVVVVKRQRARKWHDYSTDELREHLHARLAESRTEMSTVGSAVAVAQDGDGEVGAVVPSA